MVELESTVEDTITGFTDVAIAKTEWLNGCVRIGVQCKELKDKKPIEHKWFDEENLKVVKKVKAKKALDKPPAGPRQAPPRTGYV